MPIALTTTPEPPPSLIPRRKRWTREECAMLVSSGMWEQQSGSAGGESFKALLSMWRRETTPSMSLSPICWCSNGRRIRSVQRIRNLTNSHLTVKASLYARAAIMEYWVVDVSGHRLIVHGDPSPAGYRSVVAYSDLEKVAPLTSPEHELPIGEIFA